MSPLPVTTTTTSSNQKQQDGESSSTSIDTTTVAPGAPTTSTSTSTTSEAITIETAAAPSTPDGNTPATDTTNNDANRDGCIVNTPVKTIGVVLPESSNDDNNYNYSTPNGKSSADAHRAASAEISRQKLLDDELQAKELQQEQQQRRNNNTNTNSNSNNTNTNSGSKTNPKSGNKQKDNPIIPDAVDFGTLMGDIAREREQSQSDGRIQLGICAMDKKARSKPMAEILSRLDETLFRVVFFGDDLILNRPIQEWPANIDVLVAFYSKGYPLQKAKEYVKLRDPYCLNDLDMQERLQDRRMVYDLLEASGIDVPRHVFLSQDGYKSTATGDGNNQGETTVKEFDDHIEVNGVCIHKPFVEKPVDADDHNIAIYYPTSAGGGCKKLFRKIGNRSSEFYPDIHEIRRDGSYVYEEFVETQGTDVKMYTQSQRMKRSWSSWAQTRSNQRWCQHRKDGESGHLLHQAGTGRAWR